ncbi:hypothetical protein Tco_0377450 [Tanacetum coccineum]
MRTRWLNIEGVEELKRIVRIKREKKKALYTTLGRNGSMHNLSAITKMILILKTSHHGPKSSSNSSVIDAPVMRTASAAVNPCQGDSFEFYLITGSFPDGSSF